MSRREGKRSGRRVCRAKRARQQPKNKCRAQMNPGAGGGANLSMVMVLKVYVLWGFGVRPALVATRSYSDWHFCSLRDEFVCRS